MLQNINKLDYIRKINISNCLIDKHEFSTIMQVLQIHNSFVLRKKVIKLIEMNLKIKLMTRSFLLVELVLDPVPTLLDLLGRHLCLLLGYLRRVFKSVWQRGWLAQPPRLPWRLPRLVGFIPPRVLVHGHMVCIYLFLSPQEKTGGCGLPWVEKKRVCFFWLTFFFFAFSWFKCW